MAVGDRAVDAAAQLPVTVRPERCLEQPPKAVGGRCTRIDVDRAGQRAGAVQVAASPSPLAGWSAGPTVEVRPLSVYDELLEGVR